MEHSSGSNETADVNADNVQLLTQTTQITSIDGFFNRKRGRPPKNRFVEVYKSAQHSPQAIFTSFKLEKNDQPTSGSGLSASSDSAEQRLTYLRLGAAPMQTTSGSKLIPTDLTPCRPRKRARVWTVESNTQRNAPNPNPSSNVSSTAPSNDNLKSITTLDLDECRSPAQLMFSTPCLPTAASSKVLERVSVVRAAGTFYPENASTAQSTDLTESTAASDLHAERNVECCVEQPEDLSMRASKTEATGLRNEPEVGLKLRGEPEAGLKLLQFKQLIDLYQRQVLLPSFLAAVSQPAGLDMRLLLENATQQKMLLINAAAASTAAAAAASKVAATATAEQTPTPTSTPAAARTISRRTRDQDIPTGYLKFRFNEDCNFERCGYRNHQSHFHCNRRDCHYSFCDKTRFVQHTARHERMDTLMGDDFQQYRANMRCGVPDCCYATPTSTTIEDSLALGAAPKKSSHFHCRKCDYVCTDSNKVVAHRRLHMRLDYVRSAGFRKIASNESCESPGCSYALRHTHYHCITCDCSVLSRAQLSSHRHRSSQSIKQIAESASASISGQDLETRSHLNANDQVYFD